MTEYHRDIELVPVTKPLVFTRAQVPQVRNALRMAYDAGRLVGSPDEIRVTYLPDGRYSMDVTTMEVLVRATYTPTQAPKPAPPASRIDPQLKVVMIILGSVLALSAALIVTLWIMLGDLLGWLADHAGAAVGAVAFALAISWLVSVAVPSILGGGSDDGGGFIGGGGGRTFSGTFKGRIH